MAPWTPRRGLIFPFLRVSWALTWNLCGCGDTLAIRLRHYYQETADSPYRKPLFTNAIARVSGWLHLSPKRGRRAVTS
jgi:hypothetical protein